VTRPFDMSQAPQAWLALGREIMLCLCGSDPASSPVPCQQPVT